MESETKSQEPKEKDTNAESNEDGTNHKLEIEIRDDNEWLPHDIKTDVSNFLFLKVVAEVKGRFHVKITRNREIPQGIMKVQSAKEISENPVQGEKEGKEEYAEKGVPKSVTSTNIPSALLAETRNNVRETEKEKIEGGKSQTTRANDTPNNAVLEKADNSINDMLKRTEEEGAKILAGQKIQEEGKRGKKSEAATDGSRVKAKVPKLNLEQFKPHYSRTCDARFNAGQENWLKTDVNKKATKYPKQAKIIEVDYAWSRPWEPESNKTRGTPVNFLYSEKREALLKFRRHYENEIDESDESDTTEYEDPYIVQKAPKGSRVEQKMKKVAAKMGINYHKLFWQKKGQEKKCYWEHKLDKYSHKLYKSLMQNQERLTRMTDGWESVHELVIKMKKKINSVDKESEDGYYYELLRENNKLVNDIYRLRKEMKKLKQV